MKLKLIIKLRLEGDPGYILTGELVQRVISCMIKIFHYISPEVQGGEQRMTVQD